MGRGDQGCNPDGLPDVGRPQGSRGRQTGRDHRERKGDGLSGTAHHFLQVSSVKRVELGSITLIFENEDRHDPALEDYTVQTKKPRNGRERVDRLVSTIHED